MVSTTKILDRLQRYELELLAPARVARRTLGTTVGEIRRFRAAVYHEFDSLPAQDPEIADEGIDRDAWHLVVRVGQELAGCIRFVVFDQPRALDVPARVLANSRCGFSIDDRDRCLAALQTYLRGLAVRGGRVVQVGGLAVARCARRSVVAPVLCLAGTAFIRLVASPGGIIFAAEKSGGVTLYEKAGAFPLSHDGSPLEPLADTFHHDRIVVMGAAPWKNAPALEPIVEALHLMLGDMAGLLEVRCA
jgi:hypothetical protein